MKFMYSIYLKYMFIYNNSEIFALWILYSLYSVMTIILWNYLNWKTLSFIKPFLTIFKQKTT